MTCIFTCSVCGKVGEGRRLNPNSELYRIPDGWTNGQSEDHYQRMATPNKDHLHEVGQEPPLCCSLECAKKIAKPFPKLAVKSGGGCGG